MKRSFVPLGVAAGVLLLGGVMLAVMLRTALLARQDQEQLTLQVAQAEGWLKTEPHWNKLEKELFPQGLAKPTASSLLNPFQQLIVQAGVQVVELRPLERKGEQILNSEIQGTAAQLETFLLRLSKVLPGMSVQRLKVKAVDQALRCELVVTVPSSEQGRIS